jgi:hypothetical protein
MQVPIRFILTFEAIKNGEVIDLSYQNNAPAEAHIPTVGDEVVLPKEVATKKGFEKNIFTIIARRFIYDGIPAGIAGAATLVLSQEK